MAALRLSWLCAVYLGAAGGYPLGTAGGDAGGPPPAAPVTQLANTTHGTVDDNEGLASIFSPRMDFEQWKPLTGRGDPLRNDPTYDYEPPVLDRVHYWADEHLERDQRPDRGQRPERHQRPERDRRPERPHAKAEVLMLGVSSRKPSAAPPPARRPGPRPTPAQYEDFTYKLSDQYPMTILVPPPRPPPGHRPALFGPPDDAPLTAAVPTATLADTTLLPEHLSSFYALQESNLIYQSSTTHSWSTDRTAPAVSGDYMGWGTTAPPQGAPVAPLFNVSHNLISDEHVELDQHPFAFYTPMLSEAPPPPRNVLAPVMMPTFLPTVLPPTTALDTATEPSTTPTQATPVLDPPTESPPPATTETMGPTTKQAPTATIAATAETKVIDMLGPMMSMPLSGAPDRQEDNLYAYASENIQVFNDDSGRDAQVDVMQSMRPPAPPADASAPGSQQETGPHPAPRPQHEPGVQHAPEPQHEAGLQHTPGSQHAPFYVDALTSRVPAWHTPARAAALHDAETSAGPMYLIIQGHSKVKTYGSKPKTMASRDAISNEIPKPVFTDQVKHLHAKKSAKKLDTTDVNRKSKQKNLRSLLDDGYGSIEIQETDLGIKYDVSDGGDVPAEIYRRGTVHGAGPDRAVPARGRRRRQIDLEDLLPFDEDDIEEYIYKFLENKKNETSITGLIAQAVTSDEAAAVDGLEAAAVDGLEAAAVDGLEAAAVDGLEAAAVDDLEAADGLLSGDR